MDGLAAGRPVAVGLIAEVITARTLVDAQRLAIVYRPLTMAMPWERSRRCWRLARPAPWLLRGAAGGDPLSALWTLAVARFLRVDAWGTTS